MTSTHEDRHLPYRESEGSKPLRPGGAEPDRATSLDSNFMWMMIGLAIVIVAGILFGLYHSSRAPAEPEQLNTPATR